MRLRIQVYRDPATHGWSPARCTSTELQCLPSSKRHPPWRLWRTGHFSGLRPGKSEFGPRRWWKACSGSSSPGRRNSRGMWRLPVAYEPASLSCTSVVWGNKWHPPRRRDKSASGRGEEPGAPLRRWSTPQAACWCESTSGTWTSLCSLQGRRKLLPPQTETQQYLIILPPTFHPIVCLVKLSSYSIIQLQVQSRTHWLHTVHFSPTSFTFSCRLDPASRTWGPVCLPLISKRFFMLAAKTILDSDRLPYVSAQTQTQSATYYYFI